MFKTVDTYCPMVMLSFLFSDIVVKLGVLCTVPTLLTQTSHVALQFASYRGQCSNVNNTDCAEPE